MNSKKYYHGSPKKFEKFDAEFCRSGSGNEQYGSGFYFTSRKDEAAMYAGDNGFIYEVELNIDNVMTVPVNNDEEDEINPPLTKDQIRGMILDAPEYIDTLSNFGDIESEGLHKVLDMAVSAYSRYSPLMAINNLGSDFYRDQEKEVLKSIKKHVGIDGIRIERDDDVDHVVVIDVEDVVITGVEQNIKSVLEEEVEEKQSIRP